MPTPCQPPPPPHPQHFWEFPPMKKNVHNNFLITSLPFQHSCLMKFHNEDPYLKLILINKFQGNTISRVGLWGGGKKKSEHEEAQKERLVWIAGKATATGVFASPFLDKKCCRVFTVFWKATDNPINARNFEPAFFSAVAHFFSQRFYQIFHTFTFATSCRLILLTQPRDTLL